MNIIHLLSGGLDSTVMLYDLKNQGHRIHCVLFDYHQKHIQELTFSKLHCHRLKVNFTTLCLPQIPGSELTDGTGGIVVPNRNAILLSYAVAIASNRKFEVVTYACNKDDETLFPDCRESFVAAFNKMIREVGYEITVRAPYANKTKDIIAEIGRQLGVKFHETWRYGFTTSRSLSTNFRQMERRLNDPQNHLGQG